MTGVNPKVNMTTVEIVFSKTWTILAIQSDSGCLAVEYIQGLEESDRKRVLALLDRAAGYGPPANIEKFRKLTGDIYEFKAFQDRLLCFFDGKHRIVLTHGYKKKRNKADPDEIRRADRLRTAYLGSK